MRAASCSLESEPRRSIFGRGILATRRQRLGEHSGRQIQSHSLAAEFGQKANVTAWPPAEVQHTALVDNATDEGFHRTLLCLPVLRIS